MGEYLEHPILIENLSSGCYYAVGEKPPPAPPPAEPEPVATYAQGLLDGQAAGYQAGHAHGELVGDAVRADLVFRSWAPGRAWDPPDELAGARWDLSSWSADIYDPGSSWSGAVVGGLWDEASWAGHELAGEPWAVWPLPLEMLYRAQWLAAWNGSAAWAGAVWRD